MSALSRLSKPHYIYRPSQLIRRARLGDATEVVVATPWGSPLLVSRQDTIGAGIARMGVYELAVSETMWRLTAPADLVLDVGANIGYFTGLLARRARRVIALEPNPRLHRFIEGNIQRWDVHDAVTLDTRAASDVSGTATLHLPSEFEENFGVATLTGSEDTISYEVPTVRLDELIAGRMVGLAKIDVEGHELSALEGMRESLGQGLVRDLIFEDHQPLPSPVSELLVQAGFTISAIEQSLAGPRLVAPELLKQGWDAPTYLATREPERAAGRMRARGWRCLRPRRDPPREEDSSS